MFSSLFRIMTLASQVLFVTLVLLSLPSMFLSLFVSFLHYSVVLL